MIIPAPLDSACESLLPREGVTRLRFEDKRVAPESLAASESTFYKKQKRKFIFLYHYN